MKNTLLKYLKKYMTFVMTGLMALSVSHMVFAEDSDGFAVDDVFVSSDPSEFGMVPDDSAESVMPAVPRSRAMLKASRKLPSAYAPFDINDVFPELQNHSFETSDYPYVTSVKNQGTYGFCFAFAASSAMEASLVKRYYPALTVDSVDLSELQLAYYTEIRDALSQPKGCEGDTAVLDGVSFSSGVVGSNDNMVTSGIARRVGLINEADAPYSWLPSNLGSLENGELATSKNSFVLENTYMVNGADTDAIKKLVMEHGAAVAWVYYASTSLSSDRTTLYQPTSRDSNHEGCIVGWDDNYPASNFRQRPSSDGAFLVKNSYGTTTNRGGYYWLSYKDAVLGKYNVYAYDLIPVDEAESAVLQKDGGIANRNIHWSSGDKKNSVTGAQIFDVDRDMRLEAVSYYNSSAAGLHYQVSLYKTGSADWQVIDENAASGIFDSLGFKKIYLNSAYDLEAGDKLVVKIKVWSDNDAWNAEAANYVSLAIENTMSNSSYVTTVACEEGDALFWDPDTDSYIDLGERGYGNIRLKAYGEPRYRVIYHYGNGDPDVSELCYRYCPEPEAPLYDGWVFDGWYLDGKRYDFSKPLTDDITLTARYHADHEFIIDNRALFVFWNSAQIDIDDDGMAYISLDTTSTISRLFMGTAEAYREWNKEDETPCVLPEISGEDKSYRLPLDADMIGDGEAYVVPVVVEIDPSLENWQAIKLTIDPVERLIKSEVDYKADSITIVDNTGSVDIHADYIRDSVLWGNHGEEVMRLYFLSDDISGLYIGDYETMADDSELNHGSSYIDEDGGEYEVFDISFAEDGVSQEFLISLQDKDGNWKVCTFSFDKTSRKLVINYLNTANILQGKNRYYTAALIAQETFLGEPDPNTIIICKGADFPDALSANALAGVLKAPLLLSKTDVLSDPIAELLTDVWHGNVKKAIFVGLGMSDKVKESLKALGVENFETIGGKNRYETAEMVYHKVRAIQTENGISDDRAGGVFVATGLNPADALAVSSISYRFTIPVLLVKSSGMPTEDTYNIIKQNNHVFLMGGEGVVSGELISRYEADNNEPHEIRRVAGSNRYRTALEAARYFTSDDFYMYEYYDKLSMYSKTGFSAGNDDAAIDALSGGQLLGKIGSVMLFDNLSGTSSAMREFLYDDYLPHFRTGYKVYLFGRMGDESTMLCQIIKDVIRQ